MLTWRSFINLGSVIQKPRALCHNWPPSLLQTERLSTSDHHIRDYDQVSWIMNFNATVLIILSGPRYGQRAGVNA